MGGKRFCAVASLVTVIAASCRPVEEIDFYETGITGGQPSGEGGVGAFYRLQVGQTNTLPTTTTTGADAGHDAGSGGSAPSQTNTETLVPSLICSGTLITPRCVLTAGHCTGIRSGDFFSTASPITGSSAYAVVHFSEARSVSPGCLDLRIARLDTPLGGARAYGTSSPRPSQVKIVGYGPSDTPGEAPLWKREAPFDIRDDAMCRRGGAVMNAYATASTYVNGGDSGGPWFDGDKVVAVTSTKGANLSTAAALANGNGEWVDRRVAEFCCGFTNDSCEGGCCSGLQCEA